MKVEDTVMGKKITYTIDKKYLKYYQAPKIEKGTRWKRLTWGTIVHNLGRYEA